MSFPRKTLGVGEVMKGHALTSRPDSNISSGDTLIQLMTGGQNSWETAISLGCGAPRYKVRVRATKWGTQSPKNPWKKTQE